MSQNSISWLFIVLWIAIPVFGVRQQDKKKPDQGEIKLTTELVQIDVLRIGAQAGKIITGGVITLLKLAPDDYTLEVTVRDKRRRRRASPKKNNVVRTEMDFSVE